MSFVQVGNNGETVDQALGVRGGALPSGAAVLITDEVAASGGFLVAHFLRRALRATEDAATAASTSSTTPTTPAPTVPTATHSSGGLPSAAASTDADTGGSEWCAPRVCLVASEQNVAHYAQALRKLGRNIHSDMAAGRLVIVDTLTRPFRWCLEGEEAGESEAAQQKGRVGVYRYTHSGRETATRDLFNLITRALGSGGGSGGGGGGGISSEGTGPAARRVIVFDSLSAVAEAEEDTEAVNGRGEAQGDGWSIGGGGYGGGRRIGSTPDSADGRIAALLRYCSALPSCAVVALAHADASAPAAEAAGGWLAAGERRADVTLTCVAGRHHSTSRT
jgi:hypothetical protein